MRLYRANYSLVARDGRVKVDEQWVFFEAKTYSDALEKIPGLLKAMWDCSEFQLEVWGLMPDNQIVDLSMDMEIDSPREWRFFEVGYSAGSAVYLDVERDGWPLFLVSPSWLARLNKALVECRSAGGQHE
ncbi:TPA_asm: hypothetical protein GND15_002416 [Salmonella enterica subsp. salamae serovar 58:d:z6]|uniref:Uncharacterized protein n=1 Tax=Salmonella enterica subsp. salamae serovar 58:d:z6 TaxID=41517 RepID=A0A728XX25_SALER|nr:hypothetical protein [Salmonella enterica]ECG1420314.1 hypothetical protein [Salmonella enterica subsp. salamae str. CFSAN000559]HCM1946184.1 hypothetical protein [Salmonella enterica subsp. salamae serovar 30:g,m,s:e,n,x]HCM1999727.1 hypothetical protein [Salmonella enterica subsp. salamae serovar [1],40:z35:e,n,x,z15]QRR39350.1 hypothetical protein JQN60_03860 [Salmonella enterica subsp. enterica]HAE2717015.1 hypothetical protein [Salmonella enterica subsp. salamae serovar 58:d:z6]